MTWHVEIIRTQRITVLVQDWEANTTDQATERAQTLAEEDPSLWTGPHVKHGPPRPTTAYYYTGGLLSTVHRYIPHPAIQTEHQRRKKQK